FDERIRNLEIAVLHSNIAGRVQAACADLRALALKGRNELFDLQRHVTSLAKEMMAFRLKNGVHREAYLPESLIWHWAVLVVLVVAETVLNGLMLARGTVFGRLEGLIQALVLSILNLCL